MIKLNNLTVAYNDNTVISDLTYEFAKGSTQTESMKRYLKERGLAVGEADDYVE